ncbi:MAG: xanthine dehydrogenase family protein subunit M [Desulfurococcaceae archaeon]
MFYRMPEVEYVRPRTLEEALKILRDGGAEARPIAGGTDLLVDMKIGRARPKVLVDVSRLPELRKIVDEGDRVRIGAAVTIQEILGSELVSRKLPLLWQAAREFAYWQIRTMATIGGNLCNASPAADSAPPLLVYEAMAVARSAEGSREIPMTKFFAGYRRTALEDGELLAEIVVPVHKWDGQRFLKLGRRRGHDLSVVSVAVAYRLAAGSLDEVRVALGSVAPTPVRARALERALSGRPLRREAIEEVIGELDKDISPITDVRSTAEYRRHAAKVMVMDALLGAGWEA